MLPLGNSPDVSQVAATIQLAVAPVFLLAGIGAFLNACMGRLARIVDRARLVEQLMLESRGVTHDRHLRELRILDTRMRYINWSIFLAVASGAVVCIVVMMLFAAELMNVHIGTGLALLFILSMALLISGMTGFLFEVRLASATLRISKDSLQHLAPDDDDPDGA